MRVAVLVLLDAGAAAAAAAVEVVGRSSPRPAKYGCCSHARRERVGGHTMDKSGSAPCKWPSLLQLAGHQPRLCACPTTVKLLGEGARGTGSILLQSLSCSTASKKPHEQSRGLLGEGVPGGVVCWTGARHLHTPLYMLAMAEAAPQHQPMSVEA